MPAPFLQLRGRPLSLLCKQATFSLSALLKKGRLSPGPDGRGCRSRRPNTAALSHPVAWGGPSLCCGEIHEPCGFPRSAPFQRRSPILLHPNYSSQLCLLCPQTVQDSVLPLLGIPLPSCPPVPFPAPRCSEAPGLSSPIWGMYAKSAPSPSPPLALLRVLWPSLQSIFLVHYLIPKTAVIF